MDVNALTDLVVKELVEYLESNNVDCEIFEKVPDLPMIELDDIILEDLAEIIEEPAPTLLDVAEAVRSSSEILNPIADWDPEKLLAMLPPTTTPISLVDYSDSDTDDASTISITTSSSPETTSKDRASVEPEPPAADSVLKEVNLPCGTEIFVVGDGPEKIGEPPKKRFESVGALDEHRYVHE